jgi:hypothetical protein
VKDKATNHWLALTIAVLAGLAFLGARPAHAAPAKHVIIISIDGLHQADLDDPALRPYLPNISALQNSGISYTHASCSTPSDSFPGTLAYLTGAGPALTGVYYDDTYSRSLLAPGAAGTAPPGTDVQNTEAIDKDSTLISGGGDFGMNSLDPAKMVIDPATGKPLFPHSYLRVNTILEIAHEAGLRTAFMDKHPAYEIAAGLSGTGVDDLYCPEIDAKAAIIDGKLVDASTAPAGTKFKQITKSVKLGVAYDDLKIAAMLRLIHGDDARGTSHPGMPALIGMNIQALNISEKDKKGGITLEAGKEAPTPGIIEALQHSDAAIGLIVKSLKDAGEWDNTLLIVTAKHGQNPRLGDPTLGGASTLTKPLADAGIEIAHATLDDMAILWLKDPVQTAKAADLLEQIKAGPANPGIEKILWGDSLKAAGLAGDTDRSPDLIVTLSPGVILIDKLTKRSEHGGFSDDDTHVALILSGGVVAEKTRGTAQEMPVKSTQIAVTTLEALGLDAEKLKGAKTEGTTGLPGPGFETKRLAALQ